MKCLMDFLLLKRSLRNLNFMLTSLVRKHYCLFFQILKTVTSLNSSLLLHIL